MSKASTDIPAVVRPVQIIKGRGSASQISHRFARDTRQAFDDGWGTEEDEEQGTAWRTTVEWEHAKSALSRHGSPDLPFHLGLNPYRGCEHGCIYCYARPTHSYLGYSPGLDFETKLIAKQNFPEVLKAELSRPSHEAAVVMLGSVTDCYQPVERELGLTRRTIEVLAQATHDLAQFIVAEKRRGAAAEVQLFDRLLGVEVAGHLLDFLLQA